MKARERGKNESRVERHKDGVCIVYIRTEKSHGTIYFTMH